MILLIHEGPRTWGSAEVADLGVDLCGPRPCESARMVLASRGYRVDAYSMATGRIEIRVAERTTASRFVIDEFGGDTEPFGTPESPEPGRPEAPGEGDEVVLDEFEMGYGR